MAKQPSIFLDRDGTLIEDRGYIDNSTYPLYINQATEQYDIDKYSFLTTNNHE